MSRKPSKRSYKLLSWCTASPDSQDPIFIQLGCSLMQSEAYLALTCADRHCYLCMVLEAKGQLYFQFSRCTAAIYGISNSTLRENIKHLINAGFIEVVASGKSNRTKSDYRFSVRWKMPQ